MISFYPGPSKLYARVPNFLKDACASGILSMNHRSAEFEDLFKRTVDLLRQKLNIPSGYSLYFVSSATECWEIIAQSLIKKQSVHVYNGAFGKKWFDYTSRLKPEAVASPFDQETEALSVTKTFENAEVICFTQNETSNGTQVSNRILHTVRKSNPKSLIAVDATSSMGGIELDFLTADVWLASVQKCFGLPAGLGILICSPAALHRANELNERNHYNSLLFLEEMAQRNQTSYTPNVLDIYLLMRVLEEIKPIDKINKSLVARYRKWETMFDSKGNQLQLLIKNKAVRSHTVLTLEAEPDVIQLVKSKAKQAGFILGEGYGDLKNTTFRIANFPALKRNEIARLMDFLYEFI